METSAILGELSGVIDAARLAEQKFKTGVWWRGQSASREDWKLIPRVYREGRTDQDEQTITIRFMQHAQTRYDKCPPRDHFDSWLFLMQHYGLPTRLLDWTMSALVATFFAVSEREHSQKDATLWALSPILLNETQVSKKSLLHPRGVEAEPNFKGPFRSFVSVRGGNATLAVITEEIDIRMLVQQSACTIHGTPTPLEELPDSDKFLIKFEMSAGAKAQIVEDLARAGIEEWTLFPDLENLAKYLRGVRVRR